MLYFLCVAMGHRMAHCRTIQRRIVQMQVAEWANLVLLRHQLLTIRAGFSAQHLCNVSWTQNHDVRKSNDKKRGSIEPPEEEGMTFLTGEESRKQSKKEKGSNQVHSKLPSMKIPSLGLDHFN